MASARPCRFGRKRILPAVMIIAVIAVATVVAGVVSWHVFPFSAKPQKSTSLINLPSMHLTIEGLNGTELVLNEKDIGDLTSFESKGGFKTSVGSLQEIGNYTGVRISELLAPVGGMNSDCNLNVSASDGYSMVYTYNQVQGENFTSYSPATGDEVLANQPFTMILAYYHNEENLTSDKGPLRLAIVGSQGLLTDGHFWIKCVVKLKIVPSVTDW